MRVWIFRPVWRITYNLHGSIWLGCCWTSWVYHWSKWSHAYCWKGHDILFHHLHCRQYLHHTHSIPTLWFRSGIWLTWWIYIWRSANMYGSVSRVYVPSSPSYQVTPQCLTPHNLFQTKIIKLVLNTQI